MTPVTFNIVQYETMYKRYMDKKISLKEWQDYCVNTLEDLMKYNELVLHRLKGE